jgi:hypothetical protein
MDLSEEYSQHRRTTHSSHADPVSNRVPGERLRVGPPFEMPERGSELAVLATKHLQDLQKRRSAERRFLPDQPSSKKTASDGAEIVKAASDCTQVLIT